MKDPYEILGVQRTADEAAIRAAYRKLAKKHHPDVNPDKPDAAARFGEISSAYDLLSDKDKRARYDRGEIDAEGHEVHQQRQYYRDTPGQERYESAGGFSQEDLEAFLAQAFGRAGQRSDWGATGRPMHGRDMQYSLTVSFIDAATGTTRRLSLPDGKTLDVRIPPGTEDGHVLRLRGQGGPGYNGAPAGDALIEITVAPDPRFHRDGDDIITDGPGLAEGSGARHHAGSPDHPRPGPSFDPAGLRHRNPAAPARQGHPPWPPVCRTCRSSCRPAANRNWRSS